MTTVGYGEITPVSKGGRGYGMFFILVGVTLLAKLVSLLVEREKRLAKLLQQEASLEVSLSSPYELEDYENFLEVQGDGGGDDDEVKEGDCKVERIDFLAKQLIDGQYCTKDNILKILQRFDMIDRDRSGYITKEDFRVWMA